MHVTPCDGRCLYLGIYELMMDKATGCQEPRRKPFPLCWLRGELANGLRRTLGCKTYRPDKCLLTGGITVTGVCSVLPRSVARAIPPSLHDPTPSIP